MNRITLIGTLGLAMLSSLAFAPSKSDPQKAPDFVGGPWLNTADGKPITWESRKGKPTLVAFWTFACVNCQNNMRPYQRLLAKYRPKGVEMISVHTPELPEEHNVEQVKRHLRLFHIDYSVVVDNDGANWNRWGLQAWPTLFVVDGEGKIRYRWEGELNYNDRGGEAQIAKVLDALLAQ